MKMADSLKLKNLECIEWVVRPSRRTSFVSKEFSYQNCQCHLECLVESYGYSSKLYFIKNGGPHLSLKVTVRVTQSSRTFNVVSKTVNFIDTKYEIWSSQSQEITLDGSKLIFEVILHTESSTKDSSVQTSRENPEIQSKKKEFLTLLESLSDDLSKLLDEGPNHDVEFICGDQTIKAHKNILCCRSIVFASMLQSDMVEGKTGRVNIHDTDVTIFKQFLRSLYSGILPKLSVDSAYQLYETSDKYSVSSVKKPCADFLTDNLSSENACEILVLSDRHSDADFKKNVIDFIIKKKIPYIGQKWTDFCKENPILAIEVYNLFCQHFRKNII